MLEMDDFFEVASAHATEQDERRDQASIKKKRPLRDINLIVVPQTQKKAKIVTEDTYDFFETAPSTSPALDQKTPNSQKKKNSKSASEGFKQSGEDDQFLQSTTLKKSIKSKKKKMQADLN